MERHYRVERGNGTGGNFQNGIVLNKSSTAPARSFYSHAAYAPASMSAGILMSSVFVLNRGLNATRAETNYARNCYQPGEYLQGIGISVPN